MRVDRRSWTGCTRGWGTVLGAVAVALSLVGAPLGVLGVAPAAAAPLGALRLAYVGDASQLWTANPDGSGAVGHFADLSASASMRFSPDGSRAVLGHREGGPRFLGGIDLLRDDARPVRQLMSLGGRSELGADWSADGLRVAFAGPAGLGLLDLGRYDPAPTVLDAGQFQGVSWNQATGALAASELKDPSLGTAITARQPDGSGLRTVVPATAYHESPAWSPDGTQLAYVSHSAGGAYSLFVVAADGTGARQVTAALTNVTDPSWAPDGRSILVADLDPATGRCANCIVRSFGTFSVDVQTGTVTRLTTGNHRFPVLTARTVPDGSDGYSIGFSDGSSYSFGANNSLKDSPASASTPKVAMAPQLVTSSSGTSPAYGHWMTNAKGEVFAGPGVDYEGGSPSLVQPVVGISSEARTSAYWLVARDGGIFTFGPGGRFFGSTGGQRLNKPIVGMASTADGGGYWLVAADGGIFTFGDARFFGSTGALLLNQPVVGMAATPDGAGYWLVTSDGGIFAFGSARFAGSLGAVRLNRPIVAMAPTRTGAGYWLVGSDGGVFTFGDARFYGSAAASGRTAVGIHGTLG